MELADLGAHLHPHFGVEVGQRLIEQEHDRLAHDGPPHRHALPFPAGELLGLALQERFDPQNLRRLPDAGGDLATRKAPQLQAEGHVLKDGHVGIERVVLEDHRDIAVFGRHQIDELVADPHLSGGDILQSGDHAQEGGFPAPGGAHDHEEFAALHPESRLLDRDDVTGVDF